VTFESENVFAQSNVQVDGAATEKIRKLHRFNNNIQVVIVLPVQENFFKKFEKLQTFKKC